MKQILLAGDSTMTAKNEKTFINNNICHTGWGEMLPLCLGPNLIVKNFAKSGLTTDTFRSNGYYKNLLDNLNVGDYVLIQFGHNDQKDSDLLWNDRYRSNLIRYVSELIALDAIPILITPMGRNSWNCETNEYNDLLEEYAQVVIDVSIEMNIFIIDLHSITIEWIKSNGREKVKRYFYPGDFTHTNDHGAYKIASFVADELIQVIELRSNEFTWCATCPSKIPDDLLLEKEKIVTVRKAIQIVIKLNSYFKINELAKSNEPEEIIIARQNGFDIFSENELDRNITEAEFCNLLKLSCSGREIIEDHIFKKIFCKRHQMTISDVLEYLYLYEEKKNYSKSVSKFHIAGS